MFGPANRSTLTILYYCLPGHDLPWTDVADRNEYDNGGDVVIAAVVDVVVDVDSVDGGYEIHTDEDDVADGDDAMENVVVADDEYGVAAVGMKTE